MFNRAQSQTLTCGITTTRRIVTLIALGGVSVAVVATWMYRNSKRRNRMAKQIQNQQEEHINIERRKMGGADQKLTNSMEAVKNDGMDDEEQAEQMDSKETGIEEIKAEEALTAESHVEQFVKSVEEQNEDSRTNKGIGEHKSVEESFETEVQSEQHEDTSIEEFIRGHNSEPGFDWAELVDTEQKKQTEQKSEEVEQEHPENESAAKKEGEEMLQQINSHREVYAGRASMGSIASSNRQHPVNSICTCSCCVEVLNEMQSARGYKNAESPHSTHSLQSEGSADSGRATGPLTSYSPFADAANELGQAGDILPIYEFEVPNTLVGLIIGIKGKTIKELCTRADVRMLIRPHHTPGKYETHQICSVEGRRENINKCLHMIRLRFPPCRFADLNLKPVLPPPPTVTSSTNNNSLRGSPSALTLPVGVPCEIYISAHVDAGHFFVQLPTHPSFSSLSLLDQYMLSVYTQPGGAPDLPKPCNVGVLCAAPAYNGWFRAITLAYDLEQDEMLVRFVDYGGFARLPRADLRQIRTDFMTLPMQGIECYLAHVQPAAGTTYWSDKANELFQQLCVSKIIQASLIGYCKTDGIPCVELYVLDENKKTIRIDQMLMERGLAKPMDPTIMVRTPLVG